MKFMLCKFMIVSAQCYRIKNSNLMCECEPLWFRLGLDFAWWLELEYIFGLGVHSEDYE